MKVNVAPIAEGEVVGLWSWFKQSGLGEFLGLAGETGQANQHGPDAGSATPQTPEEPDEPCEPNLTGTGESPVPSVETGQANQPEPPLPSRRPPTPRKLDAPHEPWLTPTEMRALVYGNVTAPAEMIVMKTRRFLKTDVRLKPFLDDIRIQPEDEGVRLIFADWLEDHGESGLAKYFRLESHHARANPVSEGDELGLALQIQRQGFELIREGIAETLQELGIPPLQNLSGGDQQNSTAPGHLAPPARRPRVRITYDVEQPGSVEQIELPFVVGVLADLSGEPATPLPPLAQRQFVEIDPTNFDQVLRSASPRVILEVPNHFTETQDPLDVELTFHGFEDFAPSRIAFQVPLLRDQLLSRKRLQESDDPEDRDKLASLDQRLSRQLAAILHHPNFQRLESTWRGLAYLLTQTDTGKKILIRVLNVKRMELAEELGDGIEIENSSLYPMVCKDVYPPDMHQYRIEGRVGPYYPGGAVPFGILVGDYAFSHSPEDVLLLRGISRIAATAHAVFVASASPRMFGVQEFSELSAFRDLARPLSTEDHRAWNTFRESEEARFTALTLPRILARLPYGEGGMKVDAFPFEEFGGDDPHKAYLWMNAAWAYAARITDAFAEHGWFARTRGVEGGGRVKGLPVIPRHTDDGDVATRCPTEIVISDRREFELSNAGFLPLLHYTGRDFTGFLGGQSCQKPRRYEDRAANANAELSTCFWLTLCGNRFVHYLIVLALRYKIGVFMDRDELERYLNDWMSQYTLPDPGMASNEMQARPPLAEAKVSVLKVPGGGKRYQIVARMTPYFQLECLEFPVEWVAVIPD